MSTLKEVLGWGILLWVIGYILGIILFAFVPTSVLGWIITPIGTAITLYVLFKRIKSKSLRYYLLLGIVWAAIAIVLDYFLLVKVFNPEDGYYKLDVYLYYSLTLLLPILVGIKKTGREK